MKRKFLQGNSDISFTLLPQKWLLCLLTLLLSVIGTGQANAAGQREVWSKLDFNTMGQYSTIDAYPYDIVGSNTSQYRIDGSTKPLISNITIPGIGGISSNFYLQAGWTLDKDDNGRYLSNGSSGDRWIIVKNCKKDQKLVIEYRSSASNRLVNLSDGVTADGKTTYTVSADGDVGVQVPRGGSIKTIGLYQVTYTVTFSAPAPYESSLPTGTLTAKNASTDEAIESGASVDAGTQVVFTAWDFPGSSASSLVAEGKLILQGWKINGSETVDKTNIPTSGISWWHSSINYPMTVSADVSLEAVYDLCYNVNMVSADHGSAAAKIGNTDIGSGSAFRANTEITVTATPADGYLLDHWEGYLNGQGSATVWSTDFWGSSNPLKFTVNGTTFNNANGRDIYVKPVFTENVMFDDSTIGNDNKSTSWTEGTGQGISSNKYRLQTQKEYQFEFDCYQGSAQDTWNSWVLTGFNNSLDNTKFILRPDRFVYDNDTNSDGNITGGDEGRYNYTLALVGGALDMDQFKSDLNGAHVKIKVAYDGNTVFVYEVITNNGRTYTYYYPYTYEGTHIDLKVSVDRSQLRNFTANEVKAYKANTINMPAAGGYCVMTNDEGVTILEGALVGAGTRINVTAIANEGYAFNNWSSGEHTNIRSLVAGKTAYGADYDKDVYNFYAFFKSLSDFEKEWTFSGYPAELYAKDENGNLVAWEDTYNGTRVNGHKSPSSVALSAIYNADGTELEASKGLLVNNNVNKMNSYPTYLGLGKGGGLVRIPMNAGETLTFKALNTGGTKALSVVRSDGTSTTVSTYKNDPREYTVVATADGYIELVNESNADIYVEIIKKSGVRDFAFVDGTQVPAQPGCSGYINELFGDTDLKQQVIDQSTFVWTSSNPAEVQIDSETGAVIVNQSFSGSVIITATMQEVRDSNGNLTLPAVAKTYTLTTSTNNLYFEKTTVQVELETSGTATYWQKVSWNDPDNVPAGNIHYSIESTTAKYADVTEDNNGSGSWNVSIFGKGVTVVKATCGALYATYTITTYGFTFDDNTDIYDFSGSYQQTIPNATYSITEKHGAIKNWTNLSINASTGLITGLPSYDDNKGGAIVVTAVNNANASEKSTYVLTIPYKKYKWDFYNENESQDINTKQTLATINGYSHLTVGDLAPANPGAAFEVPANANIPTDDSYEYPKQYVISDMSDDQKIAIKKQLNWQNAQKLDDVKNDPTDAHNYWNYTFKTLEHLDKSSKKPIKYCNEPLFSYKKTVNGNNVCIVEDTQGLIFNCAADAFGINDATESYDVYNVNNTVTTESKERHQDEREQDRSILIYKGASFTVPFVKKDNYVKLHWYRHSTNAGDIFSVTNAKDLDGKNINPSDQIRFTGSHYQHKSDYCGYTIVQAQEDGPIKFTNTAPSSWIEIYTVELTDVYETELKVMYQKVFEQVQTSTSYGGPMNAGYNNANMDDPEIVDMHTNVISVVRDSRSTESYQSDELATTDYIESASYNPKRVKSDNVATTPTQRFGTNPIIYIGSYPGQTYGWNGWNLDVTCEPVPEDAGKLTIGLQKAVVTRIGNNICYGVHALTNFHGTGTAHVVVRTKSGKVNGDSYTLDMQEAYFPVGEYVPQNYPYTWDFTDYNITANKQGDTNGIQYRNIGSSRESSYGGWVDSKLTTRAKVAATVQSAYNTRKYNKFLFANGSQLTLNQSDNNGAVYIREAEGLRVKINDGLTSTNQYHNADAVTMDGDLLKVDGSITIPEVTEGMYVFVKGTKPFYASNTTDPLTRVTLAEAQTTTNPVVLVKDCKIMNGTYGEWNDNGQMHSKDDFTSKSHQIKIEPVTIEGASNTYTIKLNENGEYNRYLQASKWGHAFFNRDYDYDGINCAVWTIQQIGDNKYSIRSLGVAQKNIRDNGDNGQDGYLCTNSDGTLRIDSKTAVGWDFFTYHQKPESQNMVSFESNNDGDVTIYKALGGDVTFEFDGEATVTKIGVTDQVKEIKYYGYATESRAIDIDYNETRYFSAPTKMYYVTNINGWGPRKDGADNIDLDEDLEVKCEASTAEIDDRSYIVNGTGIIVKNDRIEYKKEQKNQFNGGKSYTVPFFVPACNIPVTSTTTTNMLVGSTSATQESTKIKPTKEDDTKLYYTLNISYVEVTRADNDINTTRGEVYTNIPRFYRFVGTGKGDTNEYTVTNKAYLEIDNIAGVKAADFFGINFDFDGDNGTETNIESVDIIDNSSEDGTVYNLRGQVVNGKPSARGIYIKNGKKYYVK